MGRSPFTGKDWPLNINYKLDAAKTFRKYDHLQKTFNFQGLINSFSKGCGEGGGGSVMQAYIWAGNFSKPITVIEFDL